MKKFEHPFDNYSLSPEIKNRDLEADPKAAAKRHKLLLENPLYYFNAFHYMYGGLFRAIFGYETLWDTALEQSLSKELDHLLNYHAERAEYYLEEVIFDRKLYIKGLKWKSGLKPKPLRLNRRYTYLIKGGTRGLARVNLLDSPKHVDIQLDSEDGQTIYTVTLMHYLRWKGNDQIRSLDHAKRKASQPASTEQTSASQANAAGRTLTSTEGLSFQVAHREMANKLHYLPERFKRPT